MECSVRRVAFASSLTLFACNGDDGSANAESDGTSTGSAADDTTAAGVTSDAADTTGTAESDSDSGSADSGGESGVGSTGTMSDPFCDDEGLASAEFADEAGNAWGDVAGDFSVESTFGDWTLSDGFTGCDSYIFVNDQGTATADGLRNTATTELFERSARNVHYFFLTTSGDAQAGAEAWQATIGAALAGLPKEEQDHWSTRVHFVTALDGSVAEFLGARPNQLTFAIDRAQRWDDPGSTSDTTTGAFAPAASVLGYTARYYNFRYDQDQALAARTDVTEVAILDAHEFEPDCGDNCAGLQDGPFSNANNWAVWPAEFPDATTMEAFDTMQMVVTASCGPSPDADCGHWDYEALVNLCPDQACEADAREVARWITPYARPGTRRWVIDTSELLGLVADGGTQYFQFGMIWNMNPSVWDIRFRLSNEGRGEASREVVPAFAGNRGFNDDYNTWETVEFTPPAGTTKVELYAIISGHGQDTGNCAEWCNHQHEFTVNGRQTHRREFDGEVVAQRCGEAVDDGVVPGQWGNWTPGRAGWCPGQAIAPWVVDLTDQVTVGELNTLDYVGLFGDAPVTGNRGRIRLSSYLVYSQ